MDTQVAYVPCLGRSGINYDYWSRVRLFLHIIIFVYIRRFGLPNNIQYGEFHMHNVKFSGFRYNSTHCVGSLRSAAIALNPTQVSCPINIT